MLIDNNQGKNHQKIIGDLIVDSNKCILCTGWIDLAGIEIIETYISKSKAKKILLYSNSNNKHTPKNALNALKKIKAIDHFLVLDSYKRLHSKIYYFENNDNFNAVIGSANLTANGLTNNEELSVLISGKIGSTEYLEIINYLTYINKSLKRKVK
jgi:HKD family nuclease